MKTFETGKPIIDILNATEVPKEEELVTKIGYELGLQAYEEDPNIHAKIGTTGMGLLYMEVALFVAQKIIKLIEKNIGERNGKIHGDTDVEPRVILANIDNYQKLVMDAGYMFQNAVTKSMIGAVLRKVIDEKPLLATEWAPESKVNTVIILSEAWLSISEVSKMSPEMKEKAKQGKVRASQQPNRKEVVIVTYEHKKSDTEVICTGLHYSIWTNELMIGGEYWNNFQVWNTKSWEDHTKNL